MNGKQAHKRCSTSLVTSKMLTKNAMRYHCRAINMSKIKKEEEVEEEDEKKGEKERKSKGSDNIKYWQEGRTTGNLIHCW